MTTYAMPICGGCMHLHRDETTGKGLIPWRCDAFPQRIPIEIRHSQVDHREHVEGDNDIVFEPRDTQAVAYANAIFPPKRRTVATAAQE